MRLQLFLFVAIIQGRNSVVFTEVGVWRIVVALALLGLAVAFHEKLSGVVPF